MSFEELTVSSSDLESKLKAANRLQELQTKRVETLEANNERLKASVDSHKVDERKLLTQLESSTKQLKTCRADSEAAQKSAHDWWSKLNHKSASFAENNLIVAPFHGYIPEKHANMNVDC